MSISIFDTNGSRFTNSNYLDRVPFRNALGSVCAHTNDSLFDYCYCVHWCLWLWHFRAYVRPTVQLFRYPTKANIRLAALSNRAGYLLVIVVVAADDDYNDGRDDFMYRSLSFWHRYDCTVYIFDYMCLPIFSIELLSSETKLFKKLALINGI